MVKRLPGFVDLVQIIMLQSSPVCCSGVSPVQCSGMFLRLTLSQIELDSQEIQQ